MTKYFIIILALILPILSIGQTKTEALLFIKKDLAVTNRSPPINVGGITLSKMELVGGCLTSYITIVETLLDLSDYYESMNQNKTNTFKIVSRNNETFSNYLIKAGLDLRLVISGKQSKKTRFIYISNSEMANKNNDEYDTKQYLKEVVASIQSDLPDEWEDGQTLVSVYIEGNYICYKIHTDESILTIPLLKTVKEQGTDMEESLIDGMKSEDDPFAKLFIKYVKISGMGIKYIYFSKNSKESVTFTITPHMIKIKI